MFSWLVGHSVLNTASYTSPQLSLPWSTMSRGPASFSGLNSLKGGVFFCSASGDVSEGGPTEGPNTTHTVADNRHLRVRSNAVRQVQLNPNGPSL